MEQSYRPSRRYHPSNGPGPSNPLSTSIRRVQSTVKPHLSRLRSSTGDIEAIRLQPRSTKARGDQLHHLEGMMIRKEVPGELHRFVFA